MRPPPPQRRRRKLLLLGGSAALFVVALLVVFEWFEPGAKGSNSAKLAAAGAPGLTASAGAAKSGAASPSKPHVIFLLMDDMGFNDIGYQSTDLQGMTPVMDALAADGVKLSHYYSMHICTPARAALLTGRYPLRLGMQYGILFATSAWGLPLGEILMPQYFNSAGYRSHMVGKWHLGQHKFEHLPHARGFETFLGYLGGEEDPYTHESTGVEYEGENFRDFSYADKDGFVDAATGLPRRGVNLENVYGTQATTERAIGVVRQHNAEEGPDGKRLFLYYASQAVHFPLSAPPAGSLPAEDEARIAAMGPDGEGGGETRAAFARVLRYMDLSLGRLLEALDEEGMLDNAIVVVASDNGGCPLYGGSNYPLRGFKHGYWEGGVRVPAFVWSRNAELLPAAARGTTYDGLFHVTDWLPTLGGLAGFQVDGSLVDGMDLWPRITNTASPSSPLRDGFLLNSDGFAVAYVEEDAAEPTLVTKPPAGGIRQGKWKLIVKTICEGFRATDTTDGGGGLPSDLEVCGTEVGICVMCDGCVSYEGLEYTPMPVASYLFDLEADPLEQHNVIDQHPQVVAELYALWTKDASKALPSIYKVTATEEGSFRVWARHAHWEVPWFDEFERDLAQGAVKDQAAAILAAAA